MRPAAVVGVILAAALCTRAAAFQSRTVKDKVYTKEQAARGEATFTKNCAKCHLLADRKPSDPVGVSDGPSLAGKEFLNKWDGKSVFEMTSGMRLGMPPDGSINLSETDAADIAAYLIKVNGFPEGDTPLKADASARTLMWVKPAQSGGAAVTPIADIAAATLVIPGSADFLVADDDAVWITNRGRLEKLARDKTAPVATVEMPRPCGAPAIGFGAVWVANCTDRSLFRIDRSTATVAATIPTGLADRSGELSVASGAGAVWILSDAAGKLARIDPQTNKVVATIDVAPNSFAAVFGFGSVWITNTGARDATGPGSVQRVDPTTNTVVATIPVGPKPRFLAAGEGGVWTLNQGDGTVSRIDPATNRTAATIETGASGGGGDIAAGAGRLWVRATKILLQAIDPATNRVTAQYGPPSGSGAVRVANDHVWVSAHDIQTVWVLKPSANASPRLP